MKIEELFAKAKKQTALWLSWDVVGAFISVVLTQYFEKPFAVRAEYCDVDYWCCEFGEHYIDTATQERLFEAIDATEDERIETIACDEARNGCSLPINSIGMEVSKKLLLIALGCSDVKGIPITEKGLWVICSTENQCKGDAGKINCVEETKC